MSTNKYIDTTAIMQVIGCVFNNPTILNQDDKYKIVEEDFPDQFHKIIFGTIYNLYISGTSKITLNNINDYLSTRPKAMQIYQKGKGEEWLTKIAENATEMAFNYYYNRLKKMTLLRAYYNYGVDVSDIYDPDNILDIKKKELQENNLDMMTLEQIADIVEAKIESVRFDYISNSGLESAQAGDGINELIERLKEHPELGVPLYGPLINTVTRGARLKKFYLRSAATGVGKSRSMIADACYIGCNKIFDSNFGWIKTGVAQPTLFITTEQELEEIQTMMLAFISNVDEDHIIYGNYMQDEEERVVEAANIIKSSPLYVEVLPDFSLQDVEDKIKKNIREHNVKYVFDPIGRVTGQ